KTIFQTGSNSWRAMGITEIEVFNKTFETDLPDDDYDTVGGWLAAELGRIPRRGDNISHAGLNITVVGADARRALWLHIQREDATPANDRVAEASRVACAKSRLARGDPAFLFPKPLRHAARAAAHGGGCPFAVIRHLAATCLGPALRPDRVPGLSGPPYPAGAGRTLRRSQCVAVRLRPVVGRPLLADHQHAPVRRHAPAPGDSRPAVVCGRHVAIWHGRLPARLARVARRSEEHTSELQSRENLVCRLLHEKKKKT